jgi:hypothetical protein
MAEPTPAPGGPDEPDEGEDLQAEINVGGPSAMADATAAAIRTAGGEAPPPEVVAAAQARAAEMLKEMASENDAAGFKDLQNLTLSMGLPATRAIFRQMVKAAGLRGEPKAAALQAITDLSPVTEVGCMRVEFHDRTTGAPGVAYLVLDQCPRGHDLGAQIDKLKGRVAPEKWPEAVKHLSMLVHLGRSVYARLAQANEGLIRQIFGIPASESCTKYLTLKVDRENTTLFVDAGWANRVGIYVRLEAEVEAELAAPKKDPRSKKGAK